MGHEWSNRQHFAQATTPVNGDSPAGAVVKDDTWTRTTDETFWICSSIAPITFVQVAGASHLHTVASGSGSLELSHSITVENPTATEDLSIFFSNKAITITEIRAVLVGSASPSVTWTIRHGTDRSAAGAQVVTGGTVTTSTTTGSDVTVFNDATIVADSFIWLETTAKSGTVTELHITIVYTTD